VGISTAALLWIYDKIVRKDTTVLAQ